MKATIRDVAKLANVSVATVSRVINEKGYVHPDTKNLVLEAVKKLEFEPNQLARSLTNRHSKMIGVIVPHVSTSFYGKLIEGIEDQAIKLGYKVMLCNTQDNAERELDYIKIFEQYNVEGIIIAANVHNLEKIKKITVPVVSVDHVIDESIPSLSSNNEEGGRLAAKLLIENGRKNFLILRGPSFLITTKERSKGFIDELDIHGLNYTIHDSDIINPDIKFINSFLARNPYIDGIFALADSFTEVTLGILNKYHRNIPEDVDLIGFDNVQTSEWMYPGITVISQPIKYMGEAAVNTIIDLVNNKTIDEFHREIPVELIKRGTTK